MYDNVDRMKRNAQIYNNHNSITKREQISIIEEEKKKCCKSMIKKTKRLFDQYNWIIIIYEQHDLFGLGSETGLTGEILILSSGCPGLPPFPVPVSFDVGRWDTVR